MGWSGGLWWGGDGDVFTLIISVSLRGLVRVGLGPSDQLNATTKYADMAKALLCDIIVEIVVKYRVQVDEPREFKSWVYGLSYSKNSRLMSFQLLAMGNLTLKINVDNKCLLESC